MLSFSADSIYQLIGLILSYTILAQLCQTIILLPIENSHFNPRQPGKMGFYALSFCYKKTKSKDSKIRETQGKVFEKGGSGRLPARKWIRLAANGRFVPRGLTGLMFGYIAATERKWVRLVKKYS